MLENFIYSKKKTLFEEALNKGEVLDEAIVFIEDTKEIWNHGTYFDGNTFSLFNQGDGFKFLSDDGEYKELQVTNAYKSTEYPKIKDYEYVTDLEGNTNVVNSELFTSIVPQQTLDDSFNIVETNAATLIQKVLDNEEVIYKSIENINKATGLNSNLSYVKNTNSTYISSANSLAEADIILDSVIKGLDDIIISDGNGNKYLSDDGTYKNINVLNYTGEWSISSNSTSNTIIINTEGFGLVDRFQNTIITRIVKNHTYSDIVWNRVCTDYDNNMKSWYTAHIPTELVSEYITTTEELITVIADFNNSSVYEIIACVLPNITSNGDGTKFLSDNGTYKEVSTNINLSDYALKSEVVTESQLESKGFLTQSDKTELSNYDSVLLEKLNTLESKLTEALGRISTLETELANTLNIG